MKNTILLLTVMAALSLVNAQTFAGDYALLVGVKNYGQRSGLNPLSFTENDVEELAKLLEANGYPQANVTVMTQTRSLDEPGLSPTLDNILRELDLLLAGRDASDNLLIAFAGHGVKFKDGKESYFCPINVEVTGRKNLISYDSLYEKLRFCAVRQKLILSDACRNDPLSASARYEPTRVVRSRYAPFVLVPYGTVPSTLACAPFRIEPK